jgi:hypothetical protein
MRRTRTCLYPHLPLGSAPKYPTLAVAASRMINKRPVMVAGVLVAHYVWGAPEFKLWSEKVDSVADDEDGMQMTTVSTLKDAKRQNIIHKGGMSTL